jgi:hypothetical protein
VQASIINHFMKPLATTKRAAILQSLCEEMSIRATSRITGDAPLSERFEIAATSRFHKKLSQKALLSHESPHETTAHD